MSLSGKCFRPINEGHCKNLSTSRKRIKKKKLNRKKQKKKIFKKNFKLKKKGGLGAPYDKLETFYQREEVSGILLFYSYL